MGLLEENKKMLRRNLLAGLSFALMGSTLVVSGSKAAVITLAVTDTAGQSSFVTDTLSHWNPAGDPVAGNTYVVPSGATALSLRTTADGGSQTFAGDVLNLGSGAGTNPGTLVMKNLTNSTITVTQINMDNGRIQNGGSASGAATNLTVASPNAIVVSNNAGFFDSGTAGRVINVAPSVTNNSVVVTQNTGTVNFTGGITGAGTVNFQAGTTNVSLPTGDFTSGMGTAGFTGAVGFIPVGGDRSVNIGGAATTLTWGTAGGFNPTALNLNGTSGTGTITVANPINLNGATRTINIANGSADIDAIINAGLSNTGAFGVTFAGAGRVLLSSANTFSSTAPVNIGAGQGPAVVRADHNDAFGSATIVLDTGGNASTARLELVGNHTYLNNLTFTGRNNASVAIQNISGNNTLAGKLTMGTGGSFYLMQSDAGLLTVSGANSAGGVAVSAVSGTRVLTVQGAGNGVISGVIENGGAASVGVTKAGTGTWTLSGNNTYTGPTTVSGGTLLVNGSVTAASTVTVAAAGTLGGTGSVLGNVSVDGTLAPGASVGTLTVDGDLALTTNAILAFELNADGTGDLVTGVNALTLDGVLNIAESSPGSFLSVTNASWRLFNYSGTLTDNALVLGALPAVQSGVEFRLDLSTPGQVNLVAAIPEPTALGLLLPALPLLGRRRK